MNDHPIVVDYDPNWPQQFEVLSGILKQALACLARTIHHVGSTSIPGMAAKPILDIDIELAPGVAVEAASAVLSVLGYIFEGDLGIPGRFAYRRSSPAVPFSTQRRLWPDHHLYVCPDGSRELARHLLFRDQLRSNDPLRQEYMRIKREALRRAMGIRQVYVDEKERLGAAFFHRCLNASTAISTSQFTSPVDE